MYCQEAYQFAMGPGLEKNLGFFRKSFQVFKGFKVVWFL